MENKNTKQTNVSFENLKKLGKILQENQISKLVNDGRNAKKKLDEYGVAIRNRLLSLNQPVPEAPKHIEPETPSKMSDFFKPNDRANAQRKPFDRANGKVFTPNSREPRPNKAPFGDKRPFNRDGKPSVGAKPFGPRPFGKDSARPNAPKPFSPKVGLSRGELPDTFVAKTERSFGNKNKSKRVMSDEMDTKKVTKRDKFRFDLVSIDDDDMENDGIIHMGRVKSPKAKKQKAFVPVEKAPIENATITTDNLTVKILSEKIGKPVTEIIKKFMLLGMMLNINSPIDFDTAELVASEFGITLTRAVAATNEQIVEEKFKSIELTDKRPPIVTVMGHVDHGKTSLLDYIKKTNIALGEAGGITQHIGAYSINVNGNKITFIDTPGHAAFSAMRQRGAQVTDIAILIVAADDGIMPQTVEAIKYIKESGVPMIVAINKMDKPEANPERIKQQLAENDVLPEEWGGDTLCVPISAKTGMGIDKLLEAISLVADLSDLKTKIDAPAMGTVLESRIDKGRGAMATVIIKIGTLHIGDFVVCGIASGRVRGMINYQGESLKSAGPSMAVSILGLTELPEAGDTCYVVDEKLAKDLVAERLNKIKVEKAKANSMATSLESFLATPKDQVLKTYNVLVKADVQGSAEALKDNFENMKNEEVKVSVIRSSVGAINETDVLMAQASKAVIIGFNVKPDPKAKQLAEKSGVEIKFFKIIYEAIDFIQGEIDKMLTPKYSEKVIGQVEVRQLFKISSVGTIAGSYVTEGQINRTSKVRVYRNNKLITTCDVETLQQGKDAARTIKAGFECGIKLKDFNDVAVGDRLEVFELEQIK